MRISTGSTLPRALGLAFALVFLAPFAFGQAPASTAATSSNQASLSARMTKLGFQAFKSPVAIPDFSLTGLDGRKVSLSSFKGKVVFLNFWATWCPYCINEMPSIGKLWTAMKGRDFVVMAVDVGETAATVSAFIKKNGMEFPVYLDPQGRVGDLLGVQGIPATFIIGKDGKVLARVVGGLAYDMPEVQAIFRELTQPGQISKP